MKVSNDDAERRVEPRYEAAEACSVRVETIAFPPSTLSRGNQVESIIEPRLGESVKITFEGAARSTPSSAVPEKPIGLRSAAVIWAEPHSRHTRARGFQLSSHRLNPRRGLYFATRSEGPRMIDLSPRHPNGTRYVTLEELDLPTDPCPQPSEGDQKTRFSRSIPTAASPRRRPGLAIYVFESGAIMPISTAGRPAILRREGPRLSSMDEFQMGGIGPMRGQANVFARTTRKSVGIDRYCARAAPAEVLAGGGERDGSPGISDRRIATSAGPARFVARHRHSGRDQLQRWRSNRRAPRRPRASAPPAGRAEAQIADAGDLACSLPLGRGWGWESRRGAIAPASHPQSPPQGEGGMRTRQTSDPHCAQPTQRRDQSFLKRAARRLSNGEWVDRP